MGLKRVKSREWTGKYLRISVEKSGVGQREWCVRYRPSGGWLMGGNQQAFDVAMRKAREQVASMVEDLGGTVTWVDEQRTVTAQAIGDADPVEVAIGTGKEA